MMLAAVLLRLASSEKAQMMPAERNILVKWSDMAEVGGWMGTREAVLIPRFGFGSRRV